jgi:acetyl-CoA carboxylase biotin carboxyl carrier protein
VSDNAAPSWQQLLDLVAQLDAGPYDSASITYGSVSVQLSRSGPLVTPAVTSTAPAVVPAPVTSSPEASGTIILSPMIGIFYRCPSPGAPPFVELGAHVEPDTTVGIVEVMKLMNPVSAGVPGTLTSFLVNDNEPVEYGQALAVVAEDSAS